MKTTLVLDFETEAIEPQAGPPKPVGFAFYLDGRQGYVAWGHPVGNTYTREEAELTLFELMSEASNVVCHNAQFDRGVFEKHMNLKLHHMSWDCTMAMAFLADPYQPLALKPMAERLLGMPPEEQDTLTDWIVANVPKATRKTAGAYISKAPVDLVAPYAIGDVVRTKGLHDRYFGETGGMAYRREMLLLDCILNMEDHGVKIDLPQLKNDVNDGYKWLDNLDRLIKGKIGDVDIDSDADVAEALAKRKKLKEDLPLTDKGKPSTSKGALIKCVNDKDLLGRLLLRSSLATSVRTFMSPWCDAASAHKKGRLMFRFSPIRSDYGVGARTGRLSCAPSLMNIPSEWELLFNTFKSIGYVPPFEMPNVRRYILPDDNHVLISADYSQIEMRVFAHYEDGEMLAAYQNNPTIDAHNMVAEMAGVSRKVAKTLNFAALYGAGKGVIMSQLDCTEQEASNFKRIYARAFPGVKELNDSIRHSLSTEGYITTIGGRQYKCEEPKHVKGVLRTFEYKLINYLCQGGAADIMKEAMNLYFNHEHRRGRLMFTVHDQMIVSCPKSRIKTEVKIIEQCMANALKDYLDVPLAVNIEIGSSYAEV